MFCWRREEIRLSLLRRNKTPPVTYAWVTSCNTEPSRWWVAGEVVGGFFPFHTGACLMCTELQRCWCPLGCHWSILLSTSSVTPLSPDTWHAWWFFISVKEQKSCTRSDQSPFQPHLWQPPQDAEKTVMGSGPQITSWAACAPPAMHRPWFGEGLSSSAPVVSCGFFWDSWSWHNPNWHCQVFGIEVFAMRLLPV